LSREQTGEFLVRDPGYHPLIDVASTHRRDLELVEVEGHGTRWGRDLAQNLDENEGVLDVRPDERFLRASSGQLHPQILLCVSPQLSANEAHRPEGGRVAPVQPPSGAVPL